MAAKPIKRKSKQPETEYYEIAVDDWEASYSFGVNSAGLKRFFSGDYREYSSLILNGTIISPDLKALKKAQIHILGTPELNDHYKKDEAEKPPSGVGWMEVLRDGLTLHLSCMIPSTELGFISTAVASGKIKYASVHGSKLKWRRGEISNISLVKGSSLLLTLACKFRHLPNTTFNI